MISRGAPKVVPFVEILSAMAAAKRPHPEGSRVVLGWIQITPREGCFGVRYQPEPTTEETAEGTFTPVRVF